jgi:flagellar M-ring protein FliF
MKQENGTYAVTKHTLHREDAPGRLRRVTVAVVVNDRMAMEGAGKLEHAVWKPRSSEEMHRLEGLAQAAVGYDLKRGDSVVVENVGFSSNVTAPAPVGMAKVVEQAKEVAHQEPGMVRLGMMGFVGLMVVLLVLRPVARQVVMALEEPKPLPVVLEEKAGLPGAVGGPHDQLSASASAEAMAALEAADEAEVQRLIVEDIAVRIQKKPVQSTKLLEQWINGPQETA